jgi:hypothetical protein
MFDDGFDDELDKESKWETEQESLDTYLQEWEQSRGSGLTEYDKTDDFDY